MEKIDRYIEPYVHAHLFNGVVLVARGDSVVLERACGLADSELDVPMRTGYRFQIGSITKDFTAAATLALQDRGRLQLADQLTDYLPGFPNGESIRVQHLLNHRHGIPTWQDVPGADSRRLAGASLPEVVAWLGDQPREFEAGSQRRYGSSGHLILARVIEVASGIDFNQFIRSELLDPLGLHDTGHLDPFELLPGRVSSYEPTARPPWLRRPGWFHTSMALGSANLYSTARDLFTWSRSQPARRIEWGESDEEGRRVLWTAGMVSGFVSRVHRYVNEDLTVVFLSNVDNAAFRPIVRDVAAIARGEAPRSQLPRPPRALPAEQLRNLRGSFRCEGGFRFRILVTADDRGLLFEVNGDPDQRFPLWPATEQELLLPTDLAWMRFEEDESGGRRMRYQGGFETTCTEIPPG